MGEPTVKTTIRLKKETPKSICIIRDNTQVAIGLDSGRIHALSFDERKDIKRLTGHASTVTKLAYLPETYTLISASTDATIRLWNDSTSQILKPNVGSIQGLSLCTQSKNILVYGTAQKPVVWSLDQGAEIFQVPLPTGIFTSCDIRENILCISLTDGFVRFFDARTGRETIAFKAPDKPTAVCVNEKRQLCGIGSETGFISLFDLKTSDLLFDKEAHQGEVTSFGFHPSLDAFMSSGTDGNMVIGRVRTFSLKFTIPAHSEKIIHANWSDDGQMFSSVGVDKIISVWNFPDYWGTQDDSSEAEESSGEVTQSQAESSSISETKQKIIALRNLRTKLSQLSPVFTNLEERLTKLETKIRLKQ